MNNFICNMISQYVIYILVSNNTHNQHTSTCHLVDVNPIATSAFIVSISGTRILVARSVISWAACRGIIATVTPVIGLNPEVSVAALGAELMTPVNNSFFSVTYLKLCSHYIETNPRKDSKYQLDLLLWRVIRECRFGFRQQAIISIVYPTAEVCI